MMGKALLFNSSRMYANCEETGTRSVREHGSVDEAELDSPSAMISSSERDEHASYTSTLLSADFI